MNNKLLIELATAAISVKKNQNATTDICPIIVNTVDDEPKKEGFIVHISEDGTESLFVTADESNRVTADFFKLDPVAMSMKHQRIFNAVPPASIGDPDGVKFLTTIFTNAALIAG